MRLGSSGLLLPVWDLGVDLHAVGVRECGCGRLVRGALRVQSVLAVGSAHPWVSGPGIALPDCCNLAEPSFCCSPVSWACLVSGAPTSPALWPQSWACLLPGAPASRCLLCLPSHVWTSGRSASFFVASSGLVDSVPPVLALLGVMPVLLAACWVLYTLSVVILAFLGLGLPSRPSSALLPVTALLVTLLPGLVVVMVGVELVLLGLVEVKGLLLVLFHRCLSVGSIVRAGSRLPSGAESRRVQVG